MDNYSIILALIGSVTSLLVAAIGFFAAVRAAKIAAERETARAFALNRSSKRPGSRYLCIKAA